MIVNRAAIDWHTGTSWTKQIYDTAIVLVERWAGSTPMREGRRMQYRGVEVDGLFVGEGRQQGRSHYMVQSSGVMADITWGDFAYLPLKCTRLDLQVTCPMPKRYSARRLATDLRAADWTGKPRAITLIESGDGFDTVYIGSRQSDRYIRLYVKPDSTGAPWLRFEVEYKGDLAVDMAYRMRESDNYQEVAKTALIGEILALPFPLSLHRLYQEALGDTGERPRTERVASDGRTLQWLANQVQPALMRAMNDHDSGAAVRAMVRGWAAEADMVDQTLWALGLGTEELGE